MRKKMELVSNCIAEGTNCMIVFAVMIVVLRDFVQEWPGMYRLLPFLLVPVFLYLIREFVKNAVVFFVLHFVVWMGATYLLAGADISLKVLFGIATAVFVGVSIYRRLSEGNHALGVIHPVVMTVAVVLLYAVDAYKGGSAAGSYLIRIMLVYLVVYLLYYYLQRFLQFINMNCKVTENVPVKRIFSTSFGLVSFFILVLLAIMFLFVNKEMIDYLAGMLGDWLFSLISILMRFFVHDVDMPRLEKEKIQKEKMELILGEAVPENEMLMLILNFLAMTLGTIVVIVLVTMLLIGFYRLVRQAFRADRGKELTQNEFYVEKVESIGKEKKQKKMTEKKFFYSGKPDMQVRKQYYKAMLSKKAFIKLSGQQSILFGTARENTGKYLAYEGDKKEAARTFYTTYEKARYGQESCSKEDVKQMKRSRDTLLKN